MALHQFEDAGLGAADIRIDMRHPHLIDIIAEGDSGMFLKKTAEVFFAQIELRGDILQREMFGIVEIDILGDLL